MNESSAAMSLYRISLVRVYTELHIQCTSSMQKVHMQWDVCIYIYIFIFIFIYIYIYIYLYLYAAGFTMYVWYMNGENPLPISCVGVLVNRVHSICVHFYA